MYIVQWGILAFVQFLNENFVIWILFGNCFISLWMSNIRKLFSIKTLSFKMWISCREKIWKTFFHQMDESASLSNHAFYIGSILRIFFSFLWEFGKSESKQYFLETDWGYLRIKKLKWSIRSMYTKIGIITLEKRFFFFFSISS